MIIEKYNVERRLSDYCKGCCYFESEREEYLNDGNKKVFEYCAHGNVCDALYRRVMQDGENE